MTVGNNSTGSGNGATTTANLHPTPRFHQNEPNPFRETTRIGYFLSTGKSGALVITTIDGKQIQSILITSYGEAQVELQTPTCLQAPTTTR